MTQAADYVSANTMFQGEVEDNMPRLDGTIDTVEHFLDSFETYRAKVHKYFDEKEYLGWGFHEKLVFGRLMKLLDRVKEIKVTTLTFLSLMDESKIDFVYIVFRIFWSSRSSTSSWKKSKSLG